MEPKRARQLLGLPPDAGQATVRRRYHLLARDAHPDGGGDPELFHDLQLAYRTLLDAEPGEDRGPRNVRAAANRARVDQQRLDRERLPDVDVGTVDWDRPIAAPPARADLQNVARAALGDPVQVVRLVSRGPRSLSNRWAHALEETLVTHLLVGTPLPTGGHGLVASTTGRRGRRLLDALHAEPSWTLVRQSSDHFEASRRLPVLPDLRATALLHATVISAVLERLGWPLASWRFTD